MAAAQRTSRVRPTSSTSRCTRSISADTRISLRKAVGTVTVNYIINASGGVESLGNILRLSGIGHHAGYRG